LIPPGLESVLRRAAERRERRGRVGDAQITVERLTRAEADALDGLPWPGPRPKPFLMGETRRLSLVRLEAALEAAALRPTELYTEALGRPLRDLPRERNELQAARHVFWHEVETHAIVAGDSGLQAWFEHARRTGRLSAPDRALVEGALRVLEWVTGRNAAPAVAVAPVDRAVLAAELFDGRPHALDAGTSHEGLARQLVATAFGVSPAAPARVIWAAAGVEVDPTSTSVLTLCLRARGATPLETALRSLHGTHVVLTLGQLEARRADWTDDDVFVSENPSVLRAAEHVLGPRCPPMVCSAGWPTDAVRALLGQLARSGAALRYHGDFDHEGVAIFRHMQREVGVVPWRYDADSYRAALAKNAGRDLPTLTTGRAGAGPLQHAIDVEARAVPEELVIDELLTDLRADAARRRESRGASQRPRRSA
jgi:uncharacterized protein (TIGR02679 family)